MPFLAQQERTRPRAAQQAVHVRAGERGVARLVRRLGQLHRVGEQAGRERAAHRRVVAALHLVRLDAQAPARSHRITSGRA